MNLKDVKAITIPVSAPEGYTRLDYIENTSNAYIDTGYYPNPNTTVDITYQWTTSLSVQQRLFGNGDNNSNPNFVFENYINGSGKMAYAYNDDTGNWVSSGVNAVLGQIVSIRTDGYKKRYYLRNLNTALKVLTLPLSGTATKTANDTLYIFEGNRGSGQLSGYPGLFKCYGVIISDSGIAVRNYIPVKRNSDNKAGLYDLVNNQFYTSPNNVNFVAGNEISEIDTNIIKDSNDNIIWANDAAFPYRRLEYIHFNGAEYIQTSVVNKSGYYRYFQFDLERKDVRQMTLAIYDSTLVDNLRRYYAIDFQPGTNGARGCTGGTWSSAVAIANIPLNTKMRISAVNSTASSKPRMAFNLRNLVTNTNIIATTTLTGATNGSLSNQNAYLMANHNHSSSNDFAEHYCKGKVYYFEERSENYQGARTHEQFPAQRKSDGKCGLYDIITGQFYDMKGTDITDAAAGPVVDEYWDLTEPDGWTNP